MTNLILVMLVMVGVFIAAGIGTYPAKFTPLNATEINTTKCLKNGSDYLTNISNSINLKQVNLANNFLNKSKKIYEESYYFGKQIYPFNKVIYYMLDGVFIIVLLLYMLAQLQNAGDMF